ELRKESVTPCSEPENLARPLDADISVTTTLPHHKIDLILDGKAVSGLTVIDFEQNVGASRIRMGGIAGVWTHNDHRFKGYSRRVLTNSLRWMHQAGFDTSMLFGIRGYYPKYGYAPAFPQAVFTVAVRDAERVKHDRKAFKLVNYDA